MPTRPPSFRPGGPKPPPEARPPAWRRGYDHHWRKARARFLAENPLCVACRRDGRIEPATCVDHVVPHKGDHGLFWDEANWESLCTTCHSRLTVLHDGGFGRQVTPKVPSDKPDQRASPN